MKISEHLEVMRGGGHHVPHGLDEILMDLDKRISALEPKKADAKPEERHMSQPVHSPIFDPNPLDGTSLKG